jgi:hypothetical protein
VVVVAAMRAHPKNTDIQQHGCTCIRFLAKEHSKLATQHGAIEAVLAAMTAHPYTDTTQQLGCFALGDLANGISELQVKIAELGGVEGVVAAMRAHGQSPAVQRSGCFALCNLMANNESNSTKIAALGGTNVLLTAMHTYRGMSDIIQYSCKALCILATTNGADIVVCNGIEILVAAVAYYNSNAYVQHNTIDLLGSLVGLLGSLASTYETTATAQQNFCSVADLLNVIGKTRGNAAAHSLCFSILRTKIIAIDHKTSKSLAASSVAAVVQMLKNFRSQPQATENFLNMLCLLVQFDPDTEAIPHALDRGFCVTMSSSDVSFFGTEQQFGHTVVNLPLAAQQCPAIFSVHRGVELLIELLVAKNCSRTVGRLCCQLLAVLSQDDVIKVEIMVLRGLSALENALVLFGDDADFQQSRLALLANVLGGNQVGLHYSFDGTLIQNLVEVMTRHMDNATVLKQGCIALKHLLNKKSITDHDIAHRHCTMVLLHAAKKFPDDAVLQFCCSAVLSEVWHLLDFETKTAVAAFGVDAVLETAASHENSAIGESFYGKILAKIMFFSDCEAALRQGLQTFLNFFSYINLCHVSP